MWAREIWSAFFYEANMKAKLEFDLEEPFDRNAHMRAVKADDAYRTLWEVGNDIFRPARKHGYSEPEIRSLVEKIGVDAEKLIGLLEDKFYRIMEENGVSFDEYE